jgi:MFS family permease
VPAQRRFSVDFWKFLFGQTVSNVGSSFTMFVLPLLVYKLTGSALNLAIIAAVEYVPQLLFGFVIGAWVDRVDRKRLMVFADVTQALVISSIPLLAVLGNVINMVDIRGRVCQFNTVDLLQHRRVRHNA